jgi:pyruvate kinase
MKRTTMRKTKIVATLGPACDDPGVLQGMVSAGIDVARFNMSHGTTDDHVRRLTMLRRIATETGRVVAVLFDLQGPKIRTGRLAGGRPITLVAGEEVRIRPGDFEGDATCLATGYGDLPKDVRAGDAVLIDDGLLELTVISTDGREVVCRVVEGGVVRERKGINLPHAEISAPALTAKDRKDLAFAAEMEGDFLALSFVRRPADVQECRALLHQAGSDMPVIAKIEKPQAVEQLGEIMAVSDGVMVARGDLGVEMSPEAVPVLQKRIIQGANEGRILVITATQMLESMIHHSRPTRAEAADVANAIFDGTDAVMLSAETAAGDHPVKSVAMMDRIACRAESSPFLLGRPEGLFDDSDDSEELSIAHAAYTASLEYRADAFLVYTLSGKTAILLSKTRPSIPIFALSSAPKTVRRLSLAFGVQPMLIADTKDTDSMLAHGEALIREGGLVPGGAKIIVLSGVQRMPGGTNMMQIKRL